MDQTEIAFWRTPADAHAFFSRDEHQAAMRDLYRERWQYTHFAGLWELTSPRQRVIFCQQCEGVTPARSVQSTTSRTSTDSTRLYPTN